MNSALRQIIHGWLVLLVFMSGQLAQLSHRHVVGKHSVADTCHAADHRCYHHKIPAEECLICNLILHHKVLTDGPNRPEWKPAVHFPEAESAVFCYRDDFSAKDELRVASRGPPC